MGSDQGFDDPFIPDLGQAAAVLHKVARRHAGNDGQIPRRVFPAEFVANRLQDAVRRGKGAKAADADGHPVMDQVRRLSH